MKVGVCGVGRMGAALAERLIELGHKVHVWNRTTSRCNPLVAQGAKQAPSPAALAEACEATIVIVSDDAAQEAVYAGDQGIGQASLRGNLVIDMSTVTPDAARKAGEHVRSAGGAYLECPVGGTVTPARAGKLLGMAGGDVRARETTARNALPPRRACWRVRLWSSHEACDQSATGGLLGSARRSTVDCRGKRRAQGTGG